MWLYKAQFGWRGRWHFWRNQCQLEAAAALTTSSPSAETFLSPISKAPSFCLLWLPFQVPLFFFFWPWVSAWCVVKRTVSLDSTCENFRGCGYGEGQFSALLTPVLTFVKQMLIENLSCPKHCTREYNYKKRAKPDIIPAFVELTCKEAWSDDLSSYSGELWGALKAY